MEILVITWNFPPRYGGMEYLISSVCDGLKKKHSVVVITSYSSTQGFSGDGICRPVRPGRLAFFLYALVRGAVLLRRKPGIGVVFAGSALVAPVVIILARLFGRRAIVQTHGLDLIYPSKLYQLLCVQWVRFCDRVIANSGYTANIASQKGAPMSAVAVIPPGMNGERVNSSVSAEVVKAKLGLTGRRIVLFVGRLVARKGVKEFIKESLPQIVQALPDVCFVVVGDNATDSLAHRDDLLSELKASIVELRLDGHVYLLGRVDDHELGSIYKAADLMILPAVAMKNDVEGFGIVVLEAAAAAVPAVATRVGGIPDAIEENKSGILVEPGNYRQLSRTVIDLLSNEDKRREMGKYAQSRVKEKFSWEKIVRRYEEVFSGVIG